LNDVVDAKLDYILTTNINSSRYHMPLLEGASDDIHMEQQQLPFDCKQCSQSYIIYVTLGHIA